MATFNIIGGTSIDINEVPMGTHGDTLNIYDGSTLIVNNTPVYVPLNINVTNGTILVNGASGTAPITFAVGNKITSGTKSVFNCTEGWWTVGTTDGSPNQQIDFSDYFYKTTTGGSQLIDVSMYVPGIRVEDGRKITFSGGTTITGTYPKQWEWLSSSDYYDSIFGAIDTFGTNTGDPTQGTFTIKYTSGTIPVNGLIEIRKVIDRNGPLYERFWQGTCTANDKQPELYSSWVNVAGSALATEGTSYKYLHGTTVWDRIFVQGPRQTIGTFGNGVNGMIPTPDCKIQAPQVKMWFPTTRTTAGLISAYRVMQAPVYNTNIFGPFTQLGSYVWDISLRGITYSVGDILSDAAGLKANTVAMSGCGLVNLTLPAQPTTVTEFDRIIYAASNRRYMAINGPTQDLVINELFLNSGQNASALSCGVSKGFIFKNSFVHIHNLAAASNSYCDVAADVTDGGYISNLSTNTAIRFARLPNWILTGIRTTKRSTAYSTMPIIQTTVHAGDSYVSNIEHLYQNYSQRLNMYGNVSGGLTGEGSMTFRAIGNPLLSRNPIFQQVTLAMGAAMLQGNELFYNRCFFRGITTSLNQLGGNNQYGPTLRVLDCWMGTNMATQNVPVSAIDLKKTRMGILTTNYRVINPSVSLLNNTNSWIDTYHAGDNSVGFITCCALTDYTIGSGEFIHNTRTLRNNSQISYTMPYFAKGHLSFQGTVTIPSYSGNTVTKGEYAWQGGTCGIDFQYDTSGEGGTGFNGEWLYARDPNNWTGLSLDTTKGVKLKYRITNNSGSDATFVGEIQAQTVGDPDAFTSGLTPVDQTTTVITLRNMIVGSRYWIYNSSSSVLLTSGIASSSTVTYNVENMPNGTNLLIRVRYASDSVKYLPFETNSVTSNLAADVWVSQTIDTIAI